MAPAKLDLYQSVTDHIISTIENLSEDDQLIMPWHRSGLSELPVNVDTGNAYNGINIVSLWVTAIDREFTSNIWGTYRQWKKAGAQVRKGEKSTLVIFYKEFFAEADNGQENDGERQTQRFARASWAFNAAQVDGFENPVPKELGDPIERSKAVDTYVSNTKAKINHGGDMACYWPATDTISMPDDRSFINTKTGTKTENYYAVLLHELTHYAVIRIMPRRLRDPTCFLQDRRGYSA